MASKGILFRAHKGDTVGLHAFPDPNQAVFEGVRLSNSIILYSAFGIVAGRIGRSPSKFLAQKDIGDLVLFEFLAEGFAVEVRMKPAVRRGTHVADRCNPMSLEKVDKSRKRMY